MEQANSYFQLDLRNDGTYIKIYPAKESGRVLSIAEVTGYLSSHNLNSYDIKELNRLLFLAKESELRVGDSDGIEINESMDIGVTPDGMEVRCRFYPASAKGGKMDAEEIIKDLQFREICYGIDQEAVIAYLKSPVYCTDVVLARGKSPREGRDAEIRYFFQTDVNLKPKRNEDGTVDYHELGTISHVKKGDLLAELIKEDAGDCGTNVYGQEIRPKTVKSLRLSYANNITISEDGTKAYSDVNGHASLVNGKIFVSDIYEVPADVDNSIGNIDYEGNVHVVGNVKGGFQIRAKGDIVVDGVVEDAVLNAGGQIIVQRGIHGMTKGIMCASGNIVCKFIENATVTAGGYIETEAILHSKVSAASEVRVAGKKGIITGGVIRAGSVVDALTIGSEMGTQTHIEVGVEPQKKEHFLELQKQLQADTKEIAQVKPILLNYSGKIAKGETLTKEKLLYIKQLAETLQAKEKEVAAIQEEYFKLQAEIMQSNGACVKVKKTIYPGVVVNISDASLSIRDERSFCKLIKDQGDIVIQNL